MSEEERLAHDEAAVLGSFWRKLAKFATQIPFAEEALTIYYCAFDRTTPTYVRVVLIGALAYFIDPFDLMPDVLPVIGLTDDAAVLATATKLVWDNLKPEHREAAKEAMVRMNKPAKN